MEDVITGIPAREGDLCFDESGQLMFMEAGRGLNVESDPPGWRKAFPAQQPPVQQPQARWVLQPRVDPVVAEQPLAFLGGVREESPRCTALRRLAGDSECLCPVPDRGHHVLADAQVYLRGGTEESVAASRYAAVTDGRRRRDYRVMCLAQPAEPRRERLVTGETSLGVLSQPAAQDVLPVLSGTIACREGPVSLMDVVPAAARRTRLTASRVFSAAPRASADVLA